jgi:two-component system OmpR family response regulator/two-component system response regulator RstA
MVADFLTNENYIVDIEANGLQAISRIRSTPYDAIVLDIGLPGTDGISVCRTVRGDFEGPILILTARGDEIDEVVALEVGADDYMSKPVRPRALLARLKMHLQRTETGLTSAVDSPLVVNGLAIDASSRLVQLDGQAISLTTAEFDLIWYLAERAGKVVHRSEIYQALVGIPFDGLDRSIDLRVSRLRKKIGDDPIHPTRIKSVRGVGYILAIQS